MNLMETKSEKGDGREERENRYKPRSGENIYFFKKKLIFLFIFIFLDLKNIFK